MAVKLRNTIVVIPLHRSSPYRRAALSSNSNVTQSKYNSENPKSSLYCEMSLGETSSDRPIVPSFQIRRINYHMKLPVAKKFGTLPIFPLVHTEISWGPVRFWKLGIGTSVHYSVELKT
jgi:hypothetical protein